ncbi:hypothetical protein [Sphingobacterium sp. BIGb0116]|uniref:hypothetical protein n=1 Tax=Sphingobacterium sp. BIGb0116 TaxID=2940619 RepID=UPI0021697AEB|nr:hypothetical protein [Sphingobacterium sp. BIGb0116]MCS4164413.1 hypothetical protein [Sphingobacterium sp. BIGb0116]
MSNQIYDGLLAHPDYEFKHLDKVTYDYSDEGGEVNTQYCEVVFAPEVSAFLLVNYTDETFTTVIEGKESDFLYEVGIELL